MSVCQTVVPSGYRSQILSLVHEHALSVLGINQTYERVLWPGLKTSSKVLPLLPSCQLKDKPNQTISPAPLRPILVMAHLFECITVDCMGPLPKSGHQFVLTIMCAANRYPEAIPKSSGEGTDWVSFSLIRVLI